MTLITGHLHGQGYTIEYSMLIQHGLNGINSRSRSLALPHDCVILKLTLNYLKGGLSKYATRL